MKGCLILESKIKHWFKDLRSLNSIVILSFDILCQLFNKYEFSKKKKKGREWRRDSRIGTKQWCRC
jgi:hypothetical protein